MNRGQTPAGSGVTRARFFHKTPRQSRRIAGAYVLGIPLKGRYCLVALIEPDSLDDVINPQCYEAKTNLTVDTANRTVLHPVK